MTEWFNNEDFWIDFYNYLFPESRFKDAEEEITKIINLVEFKGNKILDLCCGPGRHSVAFAMKGYDVTGVDKSNYLLNSAKMISKKNNLDIRWIEEDMRDYIEPDSFDLVINLFTSFGYFDNIEDDIKVLRNIYNSLKQSGKLIIETMGKEILARIFLETKSDTFEDGTIVIQKHKIEDNWTKISNDWIILKNNAYKKYTFSHRIFSGLELKNLVESVGFKEIKLFGNLNDDEYGLDAKRLILTAVK